MSANFLVIGAEKCGTTWLKHNLISHPDIYIPKIKELHFFNDEQNFKRGYDWYASFFDESGKKKAKGEITPGYLSGGTVVAKRIKAYNPDMKLILILRNPVERAWSHYLMLKREGISFQSFEEHIKNETFIIQKGKYSVQIEAYLEYFEKAQMLILNYDDMKNEPKTLLKRLLNFLEVDANYKSDKIKENIAAYKTTRFETINAVFRVGNTIINKVGLGPSLKSVKKRARNFLRKHNTKESKKPLISRESYNHLKNYFKNDTRYMEELWNTSLDSWK